MILANGKYKIIQWIENDFLYKMYLVEHISTGKPKIAKVFLKDKYPGTPEQLLNELNMISQLHHEALPTVTEIYNGDDSIIVIMDFIAVDSSPHIIRENGIPTERTVIEWTTQICACLNYLHNQQPPIIYRNIWPNHILLRSDGRLILKDFFGEMIVPSLIASNRIIVDSFFAAPEYYQGITDRRTDIFALGRTMYAWVTGQLRAPYKRYSIADINPTISPKLIAIINKCTEHNPDARYQTIDELLNDLMRYNGCGNHKSSS